jgi:hypothetical protein
MSYLGSTPASQFFAPGTDTFSGDGTTVAFTLSRNVATVNDILVVVNNVDQQPSNYTVLNNVLTFSPAPSAGTNNIYVRYLSTNLQSIVPQQGSVTPASLSTPNALYWDTSGNVGVGTTTPDSRLTVRTTGASNGTVASRSGLLLRADNISTGFASSRIQWTYGGLGIATKAYIEGGVYGADYLAFGKGDGSGEAMRIDSVGNVGIGTTTPAYKLDVIGTTNSSFVSRVGNLSTGASAQSILQIGTGATSERYVNLNVNYTSQYFQTAAASITTSYTDFDTQIWRNNVGTERMRINSFGQFLIATTGSLASGFIFGTTGFLQHCVPSGAAVSMTGFYNGGNLVGEIRTSTTATAYLTSSDYRLKDNIAPMTGALEKVSRLKPVTYSWKSNGEATQGFIAHELQEVVPEAVAGNKDDVDEDGNPKYQGIDTSYLVATLTAAIQEQQAMIEELKTKVAALEAR